ncbi:DUF3617 domain-containing protein [Natronospira bacteriovora]|uniref:DUF3617 family protein n=1 Tax=Natronospira bacteriovora TaxID=3069753 RepID=A0ABU0W833_9GAMM|nr:DUF3617 family protein [Natronospira sp. AB-CW4]MDQ2070073.1 DUF3617 family protein [Natronospira sp. AB-CW4]
MMMRRCLLASLLALPLTLLADTPNVEPGLWEHTSVTRISGAPMEIPEQEYTQQECLTQEELDEPDFFIQEGDGCDFYDQEISSSGMSYTMICSDHEIGTSVRMDASLSFFGDRMEGVMEGEMDSPMGQLTMIVEMSGERIGDC